MWCRKRKNGTGVWEEHFPILNWILVLTMEVMVSTNHIIVVPSLYQFITTSVSQDGQNTTENGARFWPGLGESELIYAWAITSFSIGEICGAPFAGLLIKQFPYIVTPLLASLIFAIGGVIYSLATAGWIVIISRLLSGFASTMGEVFQTSYIGEVGTQVEEFKKKGGKKSHLKDVLYVLFAFTTNGGVVFALAATSIMAQFPDVNPYRWPGWFVLAMAVAYAMIIFLFFTETKPLSAMFSCSSSVELTCSIKLASRWKMKLIVCICLAACSYAAGSFYSLIYTLFSPPLSDQFGFSVANVSHFILGVSLIHFSSVFIQILLKLFKVDNRIFLILALLGGGMGALVMGDWQAIGNDPCPSAAKASFALTNASSSGEWQADDYTNMESGMIPPEASAIGSGESGIDPTHLLTLTLEIVGEENITSNLILHNKLLRSNCKALSIPNHQCFWNPTSRITGEECNTCRPACLSKQRSLTIYQITIGASLLAVAAPLGFVFVAVVTSGYGSLKHQGKLMSMVIGVSALGRVISPLWLVETYEVTEKHTYLPMAIFSGCIGAVLVFVVILYRELAPRPDQQLNKYYITSPFHPEEEKETETKL